MKLFAALLLFPTFGFAQFGQNLATQSTGHDLTASLLDPAIWNGGALPGSWRDVSKVLEQSSRELVTLGLVFGVKPQAVQAYYENGKLARIEIIWLEAGRFFGVKTSQELGAHDAQGAERAKQAREIREAKREEKTQTAEQRKEFEATFASYERALPTAITAQVKSPGRRTSLGQTAELRTRVTEWTAGDTNLRLAIDPDQLISLTLQPKNEASRRLAQTTSLAGRRQETKAAVQTLPNGDTILTNIPMFNQGGRGYCAMGTLAMITQYYGLTLNIDQLAAKAGYKEGDTEKAEIIPIYEAAARESHLKMTQQRQFNARDVIRRLEKGQPLLVWRYFSRERDDFHRKFSLEYAANPSLTLPKPLRDEQAQWPTEQSGGHASVITGFNRQRGEILFTESWGENNRNRRMRNEEMERTAYLVFVFEP